MTDDTGMLQHSIFTIPNRSEGYTTDDNARALILTVLLEQLDLEHGKTRLIFREFAWSVSVFSGACLQSRERQIQELSPL